jgi:hypothetical protein
MAELMLAATFCKVGITAEVEVRASRNLHLARTAFDQAARLAQTIKMTKAERKRFTARYSYAKLWLRQLSEYLYRFAEQPALPEQLGQITVRLNRSPQCASFNSKDMWRRS